MISKDYLVRNWILRQGILSFIDSVNRPCPIYRHLLIHLRRNSIYGRKKTKTSHLWIERSTGIGPGLPGGGRAQRRAAIPRAHRSQPPPPPTPRLPPPLPPGPVTGATTAASSVPLPRCSRCCCSSSCPLFLLRQQHLLLRLRFLLAGGPLHLRGAAAAPPPPPPPLPTVLVVVLHLVRPIVVLALTLLAVLVLVVVVGAWACPEQQLRRPREHGGTWRMLLCRRGVGPPRLLRHRATPLRRPATGGLNFEVRLVPFIIVMIYYVGSNRLYGKIEDKYRNSSWRNVRYGFITPFTSDVNLGTWILFDRITSKWNLIVLLIQIQLER